MTSILVSYKNLPFGGKIIVLGGDFRQILPVIPKASGAKIVMASINSSILWKHFEVLTLTKNMRLESVTNQSNLEELKRAILAPTVEIVEKMNDHIVQLLPGTEKEYLSADSICGSDAYCNVDVDWINTEFLNQIKCSGLPNHSLKLKKSVPIILLRNIDPASGLCNGTRLIVRDIGTNMIGAEIVSGSHIGDKVFITRMNLISSDAGIPFKF
ncbi:uncharacterized protein LOC107481681 [Arachis duranensis]|uniref:ATP-dependent DNA helicase n=1 Tax=Arachis duranensis TaxID=130453 RepID=A0A6P4CUV9_ARADU|nr:uncharacterized protein LOC107481681 [Arachis duranensis]